MDYTETCTLLCSPARFVGALMGIKTHLPIMEGIMTHKDIGSLYISVTLSIRLMLISIVDYHLSKQLGTGMCWDKFRGFMVHK